MTIFARWQDRTTIAARLAAFAVLGALAGCSSESGRSPLPAMQLVAPAGLPSPQDIVVPMPTPVLPPAVRAPAAPEPAVEEEEPQKKRGAARKTGKPYQIRGKWYYPQAGDGYDQEGLASWYGPGFHGKSTANGETFDMGTLSAAHPTLPLPSYVAVTNKVNGRTVVVRVNDRGPYAHGRILDLSKRAAQLLGVTGAGTAAVRVRYLRMAPLMGGDAYAENFLKKQPWYQGERLTEARRPKAASLKIRASRSDAAWQTMLQTAE